jgi:hypothetical protein
MSVPSLWITVLLAAASYRIWRLLAEDVILDRPRRWIVRLPLKWKEGMLIPDGYRYRLAEFINCPWCLGFWVSIAVWIAWQADEHLTTVIAVPLAISAAVGIIRTKLDPVD